MDTSGLTAVRLVRSTPLLVFCALLLVGFALISSADEEPAEAGDFQIIVHQSNPVSELDRKEVANLFVRRYKSWDRFEFETDAEVVNLPTKSETRDAFTRAIHQKKVTAIESYWQKMLFSGRDAPPPTRENDKQVIEFVSGAPGRIGYVSSATKIDPARDKVKVLKVTY